MTKKRAIKAYCLDCEGGSSLEVTLCGIPDCPLWEHRLGCSPRSRKYQERVTKALRAHPAVAEELRQGGVDMAVFSSENAKKGLPGDNDPRAGVEAGEDVQRGGNSLKTRCPGVPSVDLRSGTP